MPVPKKVRRFLADTKTTQAIDRLVARHRAMTNQAHEVRGRVIASLHYGQHEKHRQAQKELEALQADMAVLARDIRAKTNAWTAKADAYWKLLQSTPIARS